MDRDALYRDVTEKHGPALGRVAAVYESDFQRRHELLQEIHASVRKSLELFDQRSLRNWVFRVAHNVGASHVTRRMGVRFSEPKVPSGDGAMMPRALGLIRSLPPIDRQILGLSLEGLDALVIAEITGLPPSDTALRLHRLKGALSKRIPAATSEEELLTRWGQARALPTAFTVTELEGRGLEGAAGETSGFLERLLNRRRADQRFRIGVAVALVPLLFLVRPAAELSRVALLVVLALMGVVLLVALGQWLAMSKTVKALVELRPPELMPANRRVGGNWIVILAAAGITGLAGYGLMLQKVKHEAHRHEAVESKVSLCLDPMHTNDPQCVPVLANRSPLPVLQVPVASAGNCEERRELLEATAGLGSKELMIAGAIALGDQCPHELFLPGAALKKNLLSGVIEDAERDCLTAARKRESDALQKCEQYATLACQGKSPDWRARNATFLTFMALWEGETGQPQQPWACAESPTLALLQAFAAITPESATLSSFQVTDGAAKISGWAKYRDDVNVLARRLDIVQTARGLGRVVARDPDGRVRVELFADPVAMELESAEVEPVFSDVEVIGLKGEDPRDAGEGGDVDNPYAVSMRLAGHFDFTLMFRFHRQALPSGKGSAQQYTPDVLVKHFDALVRNEPDNADAWLSLGYAHKARSRPRDAVAAFKKYLELRPETSIRKQLEDQIYFLGGQ